MKYVIIILGQNLNVVANIALANKIADNAEKSREELLAIELAKNEKIFLKQGIFKLYISYNDHHHYHNYYHR